MLRHLLFETRIGEALLALVEKRFRLAIIDAQCLGSYRPAIAPLPVAVGDK